MFPTRSSRDKAIAYITNPRKEVVIHNDHAMNFRFVPIAVRQVAESHWWSVDDCYGSLDQWICREVALWHVFFDDGEWCIARWIGAEITRTDCPVELMDMVRKAKPI